MNTEIRKEWHYAASPNEIWEYLTRADLMALWLMPNDFKPLIGHEFQFHTKPIPSLDLDGNIHCKVLEIVPFQKLSYSWKGGPGNGIFILDTVVEWTITPHNDGTKLLLKQSGFNETNIDIFYGMTDGWEKLIQKMMAHINTQKNQIQ